MTGTVAAWPAVEELASELVFLSTARGFLHSGATLACCAESREAESL